MKKIAVIVAVLATALLGVMILHRNGFDLRGSAEWLAVVGQQWWAPIAFIGLYALFTTLLLPATILTLTAGVVWGWLLGGVWVLVASTIGSALPYFLARSGAGGVARLLQRRAGRVYSALRNEGFMTLLLMRLIPVVPYNVLNYAAGLAGISVRDYLAATFIGTIPGIFIFTYLASSIASGLISPGGAFVRILIAGLLLAAVALISRRFAGRVRQRIEK